MSRLIDEDVLLKNLEWLKEYDHYVLYDVGISIDETPTVDAIPIEWLKMWFTKNGYLSGIALVDKIESDWKKENGVEESTRNI